MKRFIPACATLNACGWPLAFAAYAILSERYAGIGIYVAAGAIFGGIVLLLFAALLALLIYRFPTRSFALSISQAEPPPYKIAVGGVIIIAIGAAGVVSQLYFGGVYR
jgi:hypothetical protein